MATAVRSVPEPAATPARGLWGEQRSLTTGLLLIVTLVAFEMLAVATVMPDVRDDLGGIRLYGWAFSAFLLASLVGIVWAGEQCDRRGPAMPFIAGLILFFSGLVICGIAPAMSVLVAGRAIQGLGAGVLPAVAWVGIGRGYGEAVRPRMLALMSSAWVVPGLVGPAIAAVLAEAVSWRLVFLGLLPLVLVAAKLALPGLRQLGAPENPGNVPRRIFTAVQLAIATTLFLGGLTSPSWYVGVALAVAGLALGVPALRRLLPRGALRWAMGLPSAVAGHGMLNFAFVAGDAFVPFTLITIRGESTLLVGVLLSVSTLTWTAGTWVLERTGGRFDRRVGMAAGLLCVGMEMLAMAFSVMPAVPIVFAAGAWALGALGMGLAYPSFSLAILAEAEPGQEGAATSSMKLAESLGSALGAGIAGALVAAGSALASQSAGAVAAFIAGGAVAVIALIPAVRSGRPGEAV